MSPRGRLLFASCRSGTPFAERVAQRYQQLLKAAGSQQELQHLQAIDFQFSDSETCARLKHDVNGCDVFLFQALYDPVNERTVDENYMALLIAARTLREWGASHVTAIVPYLAYARQDKPTWSEYEPTTARLFAELAEVAGVDRLITWHVHSNQLAGFYGSMPTDMLAPVDFFVHEYQRFAGREDVIVVAPDAGVSKLILHVGQALELDCAVTAKYRPQQEEAEVSGIIGDFTNKQTAIVIDDMISSGGTVHATIQKLVEAYGIGDVYLGVSHNLCLDKAQGRLIDLHHNYGLKEMIVTDSIPQTPAFEGLPFVAMRGLSDTFARVINHVHFSHSRNMFVYDESLKVSR